MKRDWNWSDYDPREERDYVFTFGQGHVHPVTGEPLANRYVVIKGTAETTRTLMFETFGQKWSWQYPGLTEARVDQFGLTELGIA